MIIKVLGSGCKKCVKLYDNVQNAVTEYNLDDITVQKITEIADIVGYGVMMTPALVINEEVVSTGKVLQPDEIAKLVNSKK